MAILLLCIFVNVLIAIVFKLLPRFEIDTFQAIVFNYFFTLIYGTIQLGYFPIPRDFAEEQWFPFVIFLGIIFIAGFNANAYATQKIGISFTALIQKLSLIIPSIIALTFFNENLSYFKAIGIVGAIAAIILIQIPAKSNSNKQNFNLSTSDVLIFIFGVFVISGVIETLLFYMSNKGISTGVEIAVVASIFGTAGMTGAIILIYRLIKGTSSIKLKNILAGLILGFPNFYSIYLMVYLLNKGWEASVAFPVNNVGIIGLATVVAVVFFKERLTPLKWVGLSIAIVSILLISM